MIVVFGIPNCDTVKKARVWLSDHGIEHQFHDFKKHGLDSQQLAQWAQTLGWERLLNRQGSTWRKLDATVQAAVSDSASACQLMLSHTSLIKRPVVQWPERLSVGFDAAQWQAWVDGS
jgi:Spx/MgsR family transcriptional regulator